MPMKNGTVSWGSLLVVIGLMCGAMGSAIGFVAHEAIEHGKDTTVHYTGAVPLTDQDAAWIVAQAALEVDAVRELLKMHIDEFRAYVANQQ